MGSASSCLSVCNPRVPKRVLGHAPVKNFVLPEVDSDAIWGAKLDDSHHFYIRAMTWKCLLVKVLTAGLFLTNGEFVYRSSCS